MRHVLLILILILASSSTTFATQEALPLVLFSPLRSFLDLRTQNQYFTIEIKEQGELSLLVVAEEGLFLTARLLDTNKTTSLKTDIAGSSSFRELTHSHLNPGIYHVRVSRTGGAGQFSITATFSKKSRPQDVLAHTTRHDPPELPLNSSRTGLLGFYSGGITDSESFFALTLKEPGALHVLVQGEETLAIQLQLFCVTSNSPLQSETAGTASTRELTYDHLNPGTYLVYIRRTAGYGRYVVFAHHEATHRPTDVPPNNTKETAYAVFHEGRGGLLGFYSAHQTDSHAFFKVEIRTPSELKVRIEADESLMIAAQLFCEKGISLQNNTTGTSSLRELTHPHLNPGTYFIQVRRTSGYGRYRVMVTEEEKSTPRDKSPGNTRETAYPLERNQEETGLLGFYGLGQTDTFVWYKVTTETPGELFVQIEGEDSLKIAAQLFCENQTTSLHNHAAGSASYRQLHHTHLNPGTYFIQVRRSSGYGRYTLSSYVIDKSLPFDAVPNTRDKAYTLEQNEEATGLLGYTARGVSDSETWFSVTLTEPGTLLVKISGEPSLKLAAQLFSSQGQSLHNHASGSASYRELIRRDLAPGVYLVQVRRTSGFGRFRLTPYVLPHPSFSTLLQASKPEEAVKIGPDSLLSNLMGFTQGSGITRRVYYSKELKGPRPFLVHLISEDSLKTSLQITRNETHVGSDRLGIRSNRLVSLDEVIPGDYLIEITHQRGQGGYSLLTSTDHAKLLTNPISHDFGWVLTHEASTPMGFALVNSFFSDQRIHQVELKGEEKEHFRLLGDHVTDKVLLARSYEMILVRFEPLSEGEKRALLSFTTSQGVYTIPLVGHSIKEYAQWNKPRQSPKPTEVEDPSLLYGTAFFQWAMSARASSSYGETRYSAAQATGKPDTYPLHEDSPWAWTPKHPDEGQEWLQLTYEQPVYPLEVHIYETFNPGAIHAVHLLTEEGLWHPIWEKKTQVILPKEARIKVLPIHYKAPIRALRILLHTPLVLGWNAIDAVGLLGQIEEPVFFSEKKPIFEEGSVSLYPTSYDFGKENQLSLFVYNGTQRPLLLWDLQFRGSDRNHFALLQQVPKGKSLSPLESYAISIAFNPVSEGQKWTLLELQTNQGLFFLPLQGGAPR